MKKILSTMFLVLYLSSFSFASAHNVNSNQFYNKNPRHYLNPSYGYNVQRCNCANCRHASNVSTTRAVGAGLLGLATALLVVSQY